MLRTISAFLLATLSCAIVARGQQPDPSAYETVLVPISLNRFSQQGANGSRWATELWVRNSSTKEVDVFDGASVCVNQSPCFTPIPFIPGSSTVLMPGALNPISSNPGVFIYVERTHSSDIAFSSRVSDTTRRPPALGTEVAPIRESQLRTGTIELLNVPQVGAVRVLLRCYAVDFLPGDFADVRVFDQASDHLLVEHQVEYSLPFPYEERPFQVVPGYFQFPLDTIGAGPLRVEVQPGRAIRHWALVSLTDTSSVVTVIPPG